jgi:hypothetical protein
VTCYEFGVPPYEDWVIPLILEAIADGRVEYEGRSAAECLRILRTRGCESVNPRMPACDAALRGTIPLGGSCWSSVECAGDAGCDRTSACPGTCAPLRALGEPCVVIEDCAHGLGCYSGTCQRAAREGEPCSLFGAECEGGLVCVGTGPDPTCRRVESVYTGALGSPCDPDGSLCIPSSVCAFDRLEGTVPRYVCASPAPLGGPCRYAFPDACLAGQRCDADPFGMGGSFDGTCRPLPVHGEPCAGGSACAAHHVCVAGVCNRRSRIGGPCAMGVDCYSRTCVGSVCVAPMACGN